MVDEIREDLIGIDYAGRKKILALEAKLAEYEKNVEANRVTKSSDNWTCPNGCWHQGTATLINSSCKLEHPRS